MIRNSLATLTVLVPTLLFASRASSQDGRIAFVAKKGEVANLFVAKADGTAVEQLTHHPADPEGWIRISDLAWSPDGKKIAFAFQAEHICVVDTTTSTVTNLTEGKLPSPWGLPPGCWHPSWSPDGKKIAFSCGRMMAHDIWVMSSDGSNMKKLTDSDRHESSPVWSPDGGKIAFFSEVPNTSQEIYIMRADGSDPRNVTENPGVDYAPAWSPDGQRIAFVRQPVVSTTETKWGIMIEMGPEEIHLVHFDGEDGRKLSPEESHEEDPDWSPSGKRIVFSSRREHGWRSIYVMDADGGDARRLTDSSSSTEQVAPAWSPNGEHIAYKQQKGGGFELRVMSADGSNPKVVADNAESFAWAPGE